MTEKFSIKWNDFHANVSSSFGILRNEDYLHDVTLVTSDHQHTSANKLVLSACSDYFKDLFKYSKHTNLMICLQGVTSQDLSNCLDYMYHGEVQIYQDNLDRFLEVALRFQIKGLESDGMKNDDSQIDDQYEVKAPNEKEIPMNTNEIKIVRINKAEEKINAAYNTNAISDPNTIDVNTETEKHVEKLPDGSVICIECGKMLKGKSSLGNMKQHFETHIDGLSYPCENCGRSYRTTGSLRKHKSICISLNIQI